MSVSSYRVRRARSTRAPACWCDALRLAIASLVPLCLLLRSISDITRPGPNWRCASRAGHHLLANSELVRDGFLSLLSGTLLQSTGFARRRHLLREPSNQVQNHDIFSTCEVYSIRERIQNEDPSFRQRIRKRLKLRHSAGASGESTGPWHSEHPESTYRTE